MSSRLARQGFTLIELLIVIAIIGILAALLFPVFASARDKGRQIACISNARQMGIGLLEYSEDYDERFVPVADNDAGDVGCSTGVDPNPADFKTWYDWIQPYIKSGNVELCPSFGGTYPIENDAFCGQKRYVRSTYLISNNIIASGGVVKSALANIPYPSSTLLVAESPSGNTFFADAGTGFGPTSTNPGPTAMDDLMCPETGIIAGQREMHFVQYVANQTEPYCDLYGAPVPAVTAAVTCVAVDGHVKSVRMYDANDGNVTQTGNVVNDPPGGYGGFYVTGPTGELTIPGT